MLGTNCLAYLTKATGNKTKRSFITLTPDHLSGPQEAWTSQQQRLQPGKNHRYLVKELPWRRMKPR
jgi:hypothetical protein